MIDTSNRLKKGDLQSEGLWLDRFRSDAIIDFHRQVKDIVDFEIFNPERAIHQLSSIVQDAFDLGKDIQVEIIKNRVNHNLFRRD